MANKTPATENEELTISENEAKAERVAIIDYKMVSFALAGKDYAVDIMQVKEIAKASRFTFVPNTPPFVLGVYNLRGDIIPIIDLRIFFNIPTKAREADAIESMIIVGVEDQTFGIVVDSIDKVVGISKNTIQPPHPIFGDINIKYIHGVVENQGRLYILLDVKRIFGSRKLEEEKKSVDPEDSNDKMYVPEDFSTVKSSDELDITFIKETLPSLARFYVSSINENWVTQRFADWKLSRPQGSIQLKSEDDSRDYLAPFYSTDTGVLWADSYFSAVSNALPQNQAKQINVWNIGCGKGFESYSFAILLKEKYPNARIRIYANDSDLLAVSNAPMLNVPQNQITDRYKPYLVQGVGGNWTFNQTIRDMILFEYHDCTHQNSIPNMDIILARDVLSFISHEKQDALLSDIREKIKGNGVILLGQNESMPQKSGWLRNVHGDITVFSKE